MNIDDSLTVLLTLKDRSPYTYRWMSYADKVGFPFKVLIADGGADETVQRVLSDDAHFPNVSWEYIRYPYDETLTHYYAKLADGLARVETPFVVLADNDDFFIPDGLRRSVEFLHAHPDFSCYGGEIGSFELRPIRRAGQLDGVYGKMAAVIGLERPFQRQWIVNESAQQRLGHFDLSHPTNWYNVLRTEQARRHFTTLHALDLKDLLLAEFLMESLRLISGKVGTGTFAYLLRQVGTGSSSVAAVGEASYYDRMFWKSWSEDFASCVDALASAIASNDGANDAARFRPFITEVYQRAQAPALVKHVSNHIQLFRPQSIFHLQTLVRRFAQRDTVLRKVWRSVFWNAVWFLHEQRRYRRVYRADIQPVKRFLIDGPSSDEWWGTTRAD